MSKIEAELVTATKVKESSFRSRQDFLAALIRGVDKLTQDEWDVLSNDALNWHEAAVAQMDKKRLINDFQDRPESIEASETETESETTEEQPQTTSESEGESSNEQVEKPTKQPKAKRAKTVIEEIHDRYDRIDGRKDRFGITAGTKTSDAVALYNTETGATLKEVTEKLNGGRYYNILNKLKGEGHLVEKLEGGRWKVTHKDDIKE